jgi:hypothetical protein
LKARLQPVTRYAILPSGALCPGRVRVSRSPRLRDRLKPVGSRMSQFTKLLLGCVFLGASVSALVAPMTPVDPPASQRGPLAERYVRQRLALWQNRLKLQEWNITLVLSHPSDLRHGTLGNIRWDAEKKTARIRVLDASEYHRPFQSTLNDMEFTVVHELIHLEFSPVTRNEESRSAESRTAEEEAVNRMADSLLQLDRKNSKAIGDASVR